MKEFYIVKNILTKKDRKYLLKTIKPCMLGEKELNELYNNTKHYPAKQTVSNLHENPKLTPIFNKLIHSVEKKIDLKFLILKSWAVETKGRKEDLYWHNHVDCDFSLIYYLKTIPFVNTGTLFQFENVEYIKTYNNSCLIFPGEYIHSPPITPFPFRFNRYTLAMDLKCK